MLIFTQPKGHTKGQKTFFFVKICFKSCIIKNRSQMYTSEKNTNELTVRRGGGSTLTVSLTVKYPGFFLTASLISLCNVWLIDFDQAPWHGVDDHWHVKSRCLIYCDQSWLMLKMIMMHRQTAGVDMWIKVTSVMKNPHAGGETSDFGEHQFVLMDFQV